MPLARIITDSVEDSLELSIQLRARGFQVETVAPGEVPNTLADLEVRLEECSPEDVMTRAAESNQELDDLWVFVAPGALDDRVRPIREVSTPSARSADAAPAQPRATYAKSVVHINVPEDDPLLCELEAQAPPAVPASLANQSAVEPIRIEAMKSVPAVVLASPVVREVERELPEVVVFPKPVPKQVATVTERQHAAQTVTPSREAERPTDMKFWRIASAVAVLAIAALILGANMSREPQPVTTQNATVTVVSVSLQRSQTGKRSAANQRDAHLNAAPIHVAKAQVPPTIVSKPSAKQPAAHKAAHHHSSVRGNDIIAQDTVVFYDGRGSAAAKSHSTTAKQ